MGVSLVAIAGLLVLPACSDDTDPPGGTDAAAEAGTGDLDAAADAAGHDAAASPRDAATDAALPDCDPPCAGSTPLCDRAQGRCVECLGDGDCHEPTPRCDPGALTCVLCLEASDCTDDPARPACLFVSHECVQCRDDRDCDVFSVAPRCDPDAHTCGACQVGGAECASLGACLADGATDGDDALWAGHAGGCAGCNEDVECEAEDACDPWAHECVVARGNVGWCQECFADADCPAGDGCVAVHHPPGGGPVTGTVCARLCADPGAFPDGDTRCAAEIGRGTACRTTEGRDGSARQACLPSRTTCEGFADAAAQAACASPDDCGAEGLDDGLCVPGDDTCTIDCESVADCPAGFDRCDGVPQRCRAGN